MLFRRTGVSTEAVRAAVVSPAFFFLGHMKTSEMQSSLTGHKISQHPYLGLPSLWNVGKTFLRLLNHLVCDILVQQ